MSALPRWASILGSFAMTGEQVFSTTGTTNDMALNSAVSVLRLTGSAAQTLTGITGGFAGRLLLVINEEVGFSATFNHENAGSTAANRFTLRNASSLVLNNGGAALLRYDGSTSRWRVIAMSTSQYNDQLTAANSFVAQSTVTLSAVQTPTSISGTVNDWAPTSSFRYRIAASAAATITGLSSGASAGRFITFTNASAFNITIAHEGTTSTAANRFACPGSVALVVPPGASGFGYYDSTLSRWVVIGDGSCYSQGAGTLTGALVVPPWTSGRYYMLPNASNPGTSNTLGNGNIRAYKFPVSSVSALTRIGADVAVVGDVGSKVRLGIYADDGTGKPGALIVDAGQIAGDSATAQELTISTTIGPGWYWLAAAVQGAATTQPTLRTIPVTSSQGADDVGTTIPTAGLAALGWGATTTIPLVGSTLPASYAPANTINACPRIFLKT